MEEKLTQASEECTHDCSTCGGSCQTSTGEDGKPKPSFFDKIDDLVGQLDDDQVMDMLNKVTSELEKE